MWVRFQMSARWHVGSSPYIHIYIAMVQSIGKTFETRCLAHLGSYLWRLEDPSKLHVWDGALLLNLEWDHVKCVESSNDHVDKDERNRAGPFASKASTPGDASFRLPSEHGGDRGGGSVKMDWDAKSWRGRGGREERMVEIEIIVLGWLLLAWRLGLHSICVLLVSRWTWASSWFAIVWLSKERKKDAQHEVVVLRMLRSSPMQSEVRHFPEVLGPLLNGPPKTCQSPAKCSSLKCLQKVRNFTNELLWVAQWQRPLQCCFTEQALQVQCASTFSSRFSASLLCPLPWASHLGHLG